jgi:thioredoxin-related protein
MEKETFQNPLVKKRLAADYIAIKVDTDREKILSEKFRIRGLPDNWFLSKNGDIVGHRPGYIPAELFLKILESISANETE